MLESQGSVIIIWGQGYLENVGKVEQGDLYKAAVDKVTEGIRKQTNQALARF